MPDAYSYQGETLPTDTSALWRWISLARVRDSQAYSMRSHQVSTRHQSGRSRRCCRHPGRFQPSMVNAYRTGGATEQFTPHSSRWNSGDGRQTILRPSPTGYHSWSLEEYPLQHPMQLLREGFGANISRSDSTGVPTYFGVFLGGCLPLRPIEYLHLLNIKSVKPIQKKFLARILVPQCWKDAFWS